MCMNSICSEALRGWRRNWSCDGSDKGHMIRPRFAGCDDENALCRFSIGTEHSRDTAQAEQIPLVCTYLLFLISCKSSKGCWFGTRSCGNGRRCAVRLRPFVFQTVLLAPLFCTIYFHISLPLAALFFRIGQYLAGKLHNPLSRAPSICFRMFMGQFAPTCIVVLCDDAIWPNCAH